MIDKKKKAQFVKRYKDKIRMVRPYEKDWKFHNDRIAQIIVRKAREVLGYSPKTISTDIMWSLYRSSKSACFD